VFIIAGSHLISEAESNPRFISLTHINIFVLLMPSFPRIASPLGFSDIIFMLSVFFPRVLHVHLEAVLTLILSGAENPHKLPSIMSTIFFILFKC
jgi:hypothetical protein